MYQVGTLASWLSENMGTQGAAAGGPYSYRSSAASPSAATVVVDRTKIRASFAEDGKPATDALRDKNAMTKARGQRSRVWTRVARPPAALRGDPAQGTTDRSAVSGCYRTNIVAFSPLEQGSGPAIHPKERL